MDGNIDQLGLKPTGSTKNPLVDVTSPDDDEKKKKKTLASQVIDSLKENYEGKFYLTFAYEGIDNVDARHITHTYFGEMSSAELTRLIEICDLYFKSSPFEPFNVVMDKEEYFGENKDIRVLRASTPDKLSNSWLPKLARLVYPFNKSKFKDEPYKPHTTDDTEAIITGTIDRVAIMSGNSVVREWK